MNGREFEIEVLRVARHLWPNDASGGPEFIAERERDGVFHEEDVIHLLEVTVDRSESKAKQDCRKLSRLASEMRKRHEDKVVKCWFITKGEPTDRQRAVARAANYPIHAIAFTEFQGRLVDARDYLHLREKHRFGSAANPGSQGMPPEFISVDIKERDGISLYSVDGIARGLLDGQRVALTADFGSGKSMVLREVFLRLRKYYLSGKTSIFPVHINLREHSGAEYPSEVFERHARIIGFHDPSKLVRAWRAGYVVVILDGFDEITSRGFQGKWAKLKELRSQALAAIRGLIQQHPSNAGVITAGREFYFDSYGELKSCLGLSGNIDLTLNEFTEDQVSSLLESLGVSVTQAAPAWLPKRPLFVATLALRGYLADLRGKNYGSRGDGWNQLIQSICEREAEISRTLDSETVRRVLERVATIARSSGSGDSISQTDLVRAFHDVCGYEPDEEGLVLLERLPGLGISEGGSGSRSFVDPDFEFALGAGDLCRFYVEPWGEHEALLQVVRPLSAVGVAVASAILEQDERGRNPGPAFDRCGPASCVTFDVYQVAKELGAAIGRDLSVYDVHIDALDVSGAVSQPHQVFYRECIVDFIDIDPSSEAVETVRLRGCMVQSLSGVHAESDLPKGFLDDRCVVEEFSDKAGSNAEIMSGQFSTPIKVLLVTLRKLYVQGGSARKENAFYRGLDTNAQRYVSDVLDILGSEGLATRDRRGSAPVVAQNKGEVKRVLAVLAAPETSPDPLMVRVRALA